MYSPERVKVVYGVKCYRPHFSQSQLYEVGAPLLSLIALPFPILCDIISNTWDDSRSLLCNMGIKPAYLYLDASLWTTWLSTYLIKLKG